MASLAAFCSHLIGACYGLNKINRVVIGDELQGVCNTVDEIVWRIIVIRAVLFD